MNYDGAGAATAAGTGGVLAMTGAPDVLWMVLGAFALICVGSALMRIVPRKEK